MRQLAADSLRSGAQLLCTVALRVFPCARAKISSERGAPKTPYSAVWRVPECLVAAAQVSAVFDADEYVANGRDAREREAEHPLGQVASVDEV